MRAALYARLSRDRDGLSTGPDRQLADCRALAAARGWQVVGEFVDRDVSARSQTPRPAYEAMMDELDGGAVDVVVAWKLDRLLRRPRDFEDLWDRLDGKGASFATVADGIDSTQPVVGELMPRLLTTFARLESQHLSLREKRKHDELAAAGKRAGGGHRPFGLSADWARVVKREAREIRLAAAAIISGTASRNSVAIEWNRRGIRTSCGNLWTQHKVGGMLGSPRIAGGRMHRGRLVVTGAIPAILDVTTWHALRAAIATKPRRAPGRYLLSGFLRCSECGAVLLMRRRAKDNAPYYGCAKLAGRGGCGRVHVIAMPLEAYVEDRVLRALAAELGESVATRIERAAPDDELERLHADESALAQLAEDHYVTHLIGRDEFFAVRQPLEARITERRRRLARHAGTRLAAETLADPTKGWHHADLTVRRRLLDELVEAIRVSPASHKGASFDPARVEILWRT